MKYILIISESYYYLYVYKNYVLHIIGRFRNIDSHKGRGKAWWETEWNAVLIPHHSILQRNQE